MSIKFMVATNTRLDKLEAELAELRMIADALGVKDKDNGLGTTQIDNRAAGTKRTRVYKRRSGSSEG